MADYYRQTATDIVCGNQFAATDLLQLLKACDPDMDSWPPCEAEYDGNLTVTVKSDDFFDDDKFFEIINDWCARYPEEHGYVSLSYTSNRYNDGNFGGAVIAWARGEVRFFDPVMYAEEWLRKGGEI